MIRNPLVPPALELLVLSNTAINLYGDALAESEITVSLDTSFIELNSTLVAVLGIFIVLVAKMFSA